MVYAISFLMHNGFNNVSILVFKRLEMFGIHVPRYALVNREVPYQQLDDFIEEEDFVEVHGMRFWKPFVEKPIDGELFYSFKIENILRRPFDLIYAVKTMSFCVI